MNNESVEALKQISQDAKGLYKFIISHLDEEVTDILQLEFNVIFDNYCSKLDWMLYDLKIPTDVLDQHLNEEKVLAEVVRESERSNFDGARIIFLRYVAGYYTSVHQKKFVEEKVLN